MEFGGVDNSLTKSGEDIEWFINTELYLWGINLFDVKYDGDTMTEVGIRSAIFDSSS